MLVYLRTPEILSLSFETYSVITRVNSSISEFSFAPIYLISTRRVEFISGTSRTCASN